MKKLLVIMAMLLSVAGLKAQSISHIETTNNWYYIYDQDGKKTKTLSSTIGELQGFSSSFFVVKSGSWYYIYDATGKKTKTLSESTVGKILSVSGETFLVKSAPGYTLGAKRVRRLTQGRQDEE